MTLKFIKTKISRDPDLEKLPDLTPLKTCTIPNRSTAPRNGDVEIINNEPYYTNLVIFDTEHSLAYAIVSSY